MTIDLTGIAVAATGGFFSILGIVVSAWLMSKMNDKKAAVTLAQAVSNSLGAIQTATTSQIQAMHPEMKIPGVPESLRPGVQYVLDHAGDEASRLGITPVAIAQKIDAKIGLANISTNLAVAGNNSPVVPAPLAPVATTHAQLQAS